MFAYIHFRNEKALGNEPKADERSLPTDASVRVLGTGSQASANVTGFHDRLASMFGANWTMPAGTGARPRTAGTKSANTRPEVGSTDQFGRLTRLESHPEPRYLFDFGLSLTLTARWRLKGSVILHQEKSGISTSCCAA